MGHRPRLLRDGQEPELDALPTLPLLPREVLCPLPELQLEFRTGHPIRLALQRETQGVVRR